MSRLASRLALAALSLAAVAACSDSPVGPRPYATTPERTTSVELNAGDSLDLAQLGSDRFGMLRVANCASTDPEVANVADAERLVAIGAGEAMVRCVGAFDRRLDSTIMTGEELPTDGLEENLTWVTFDVSLHVIALDASAADAAEGNDQ